MRVTAEQARYHPFSSAVAFKLARLGTTGARAFRPGLVLYGD